MELINREEAIEAIRAIKEVMLTNGEVINALYHVPTIESRPKGEWRETINSIVGNLTGYAYKCSCCGLDLPYKTEFCQDCGADMRGGE